VQTKTSPIVINSPPKEVITQNFFAPPSSWNGH
jgi:hypothetical protein